MEALRPAESEGRPSGEREVRQGPRGVPARGGAFRRGQQAERDHDRRAEELEGGQFPERERAVGAPCGWRDAGEGDACGGARYGGDTVAASRSSKAISSSSLETTIVSFPIQLRWQLFFTIVLCKSELAGRCSALAETLTLGREISFSGRRGRCAALSAPGALLFIIAIEDNTSKPDDDSVLL